MLAMNTVLNIDLESKIPKYQQIVDCITDAIRRGKLKKDQRIYSINEMSNEYFLSRDTVEKAYNILRGRGIISAIRGKGYFIRDVFIHVPVKVLLIFNKISNYKKQVYSAFIEAIGPDAIVDLKFHHYNTQVFKSLVDNYINEYNYFVVMPHFYEDQEKAYQILQSIPPDKLVILDKKVTFSDIKAAAVYQDFENDIVDALDEGLDLLQKYDELYLVFPKLIPYPPEIARGFRKFCMQNDYKYEIIPEINFSTVVRPGKAFIVIEETDLVNLIKKCRLKKLKIGKEIGIISYNETPLKEILLDGITVISTDHENMGEAAAHLILTNSKEKIKNPFKLIRRKSL
jgi:DNA-binding transcriptional regulator YhcF (GntR family)